MTIVGARLVLPSVVLTGKPDKLAHPTVVVSDKSLNQQYSSAKHEFFLFCAVLP